MPQMKPWREVLIRVLIVAQIASLLTWVNLIGANWLRFQRDEGGLAWLGKVNGPFWLVWLGQATKTPNIERVLYWPVGSFVCRNFFRECCSGWSPEELEARVPCQFLVTWLKLVAIVALIDLLFRWRILRWLALGRRPMFMACLCACGSALLLEFWTSLPGLHYWEGLPAMAVVSAAVVNVLLLLVLSRLPRPRIRRAAYAFPFWLAWIWWWSDLRFHLYFSLSALRYPENTLRIVAPLLGYVLYVMALEERAPDPSAWGHVARFKVRGEQPDVEVRQGGVS